MSLGFNNSPLVRFREVGTRVVPASRNFYDPVIRSINDEPDFQLLYQRVDDEIDAFRQQLGMPALQQ